MPDIVVITKNLLLYGECDNGKGAIACTGYQVLLPAEVAREALRAQDIPYARKAFLGELVICNNDLIVQHIAVRNTHPIQAKGQNGDDDRFFPPALPEPRSEVELAEGSALRFWFCCFFLWCGLCHGDKDTCMAFSGQYCLGFLV